jgi:hypothetical protein
MYFADCPEMTLGKEAFAECQLVDTRQRNLFVESYSSALGKG